MSITTSRGERAATRTAVAARLDGLLERSAQGDTASFAALYDETASQAFGLSIRLLRDHAFAEDAVQEAYLTIWRKAASFDPLRGGGLGWILMIVHHTAVNHIRAAEARSARDGRFAREHIALRQRDGDPTHDLTNAMDEASVVRAAVAGLPLKQRQALELAYLDGYTYREVAELLGIPLGTAKTRIRDGRVRLGESTTIRAIQSAQDAHDTTEKEAPIGRGCSTRIGVVAGEVA